MCRQASRLACTGEPCSPTPRRLGLAAPRDSASLPPSGHNRHGCRLCGAGAPLRMRAGQPGNTASRPTRVLRQNGISPSRRSSPCFRQRGDRAQADERNGCGGCPDSETVTCRKAEPLYRSPANHTSRASTDAPLLGFRVPLCCLPNVLGAAVGAALLATHRVVCTLGMAATLALAQAT